MRDRSAQRFALVARFSTLAYQLVLLPGAEVVMTAHRLKCSHPFSAVHFVRTWRERTCDGKLLREIARVHIARCEAGHMQAIARTHETHIANAACAPNGPLFQPRFSEKVGPTRFPKNR